MSNDRIKELKAIARFSNELLIEYKENNEEVPDFVYEKITLVYDELIGELKADTERLKADTERLKATTETAKFANKVFEKK